MWWLIGSAPNFLCFVMVPDRSGHGRRGRRFWWRPAVAASPPRPPQPCTRPGRKTPVTNTGRSAFSQNPGLWIQIRIRIHVPSWIRISIQNADLDPGGEYLKNDNRINNKACKLLIIVILLTLTKKFNIKWEQKPSCWYPTDEGKSHKTLFMVIFTKFKSHTIRIRTWIRIENKQLDPDSQ